MALLLLQCLQSVSLGIQSLCQMGLLLLQQYLLFLVLHVLFLLVDVHPDHVVLLDLFGPDQLSQVLLLTPQLGNAEVEHSQVIL